MPIYQNTPKEMFLGLVMDANQALPLPLDYENVAVSQLAAASTPSGKTYNTRAVLSPTLNRDYLNNVTLTWRRLPISSVMRGVSVQVEKYFPTIVGSGSGTIIGTTHDLLPILNKKYGLNLTTDDVVRATFARGNSKVGGRYYRDIQMTMNGKSLMYSGTLLVRWIDKAPTLEQVMTNDQLAGLAWLGGNDFVTPGRKQSGEWPSYGIDFSAQSSAIITGGSTAVNAIVAKVNQVMGETYLNNSQHTAQGGISGLTLARYNLPHASVPYANSQDYNRVAVITAQSNSWFQGRMYFHYNA